VCEREREKETEYSANSSGEYQGFFFLRSNLKSASPTENSTGFSVFGIQS
jgi:hypothetical protein